MTQSVQIDEKAVEAKAEAAFGFLTGAVVSGMIFLGDELGLYRSLRGAGPLTSQQFAERTGLNERWLREWLQGQAAAGLLEYRGDGKFELSPEGALVLADEENPASVIGAFGGLPDSLALLNKVTGSFRTGRGLTYDEGGLATAVGVERMLGPWNKTLLVTEALPKIAGLVEKLKAGAKVADVGCGAGVALIAMAKAFPKSQFHGYDNSKFALQRAAANLKESGLKNVTFHDSDKEGIPGDASFDLVTCLDCLHDMARPDLAAAAIRKAIKPDGAWFIVDVDCKPTFEGNLENPLSPLMYGYSILTCMSSSLSTPDGLGLGTVGLPEPKMKELATNAGFDSFKRVPGLEHPFNAYYEARP